jgi:hypothetical protein
VLDELSFKKEVCQCRKCNKVFHQSEIRRVHKGLGIELQCPDPSCGSTEFGLMNYPIDECDMIYKTKNYWNRTKFISKYISNNLVSYTYNK